MLVGFAMRLYRLYRPYFGWQGDDLKRTLWAGLLLLGNIALGFALTFINITLDALIGVLQQPGVTYSSFFGALSLFFTAALIYAVIQFIDTMIANWLDGSLTHAISIDLEKRWILSRAFYGLTIMPDPVINNLEQSPDKNATTLNPALVISEDNPELNSSVAYLVDTYLTALSSAIVGIIGLFALSGPITITLFAVSITIPAYIPFFTVLYALAYNHLTYLLGRPLKAHQNSYKQARGFLYQTIFHIINYAEAIAFKAGTFFEHQTLLAALQRNKQVQSLLAKIRSSLTFLNAIHLQISHVFALVLAAPNIIAQRITFPSVLQLSYHFAAVVQFFTWSSDNYETLHTCEVALTRIERLNARISEWEQIQRESAKNLIFSNTQIQSINIEHLSIQSPDGKEILANFNASFPFGEIILIEGASGSGKTSLLRVLAGIHPYAKGEIKNLPKDVVFVPSQPYFPQNKNLLECIIYPRQESATPQEIAEIKSLMQRIGLKKSIIDDLESVKDWNGRDLSDGEKQRISIVSAIFKKPSLLVMDEATSRVDHHRKTRTKEKIEQLLTELNQTKKTTILYTDHNPSGDHFHHHKLSLKAW